MALRRIIEATLAGEPVAVRTAVNAADATASIPVDQPDMVIVDADVPGENGNDVAAFVKRRPSLASTPVWLIGDARAAVKAVTGVPAPGYDQVLVLPLDPPQLAARVRQLLKTTAERAAPPEEESFDAFLERLDSRLASLDARKAHATTEPTAGAPQLGTMPESLSVPTLSTLLDSAQEPAPASGERPGRATPDVAAEEVARRVMARLSSGPMHEIVSRIVAEVAARLAIEEAEKHV
jgi:CheY-like chemotaxis protein